jgi:hypothetical protein
MTQHPDFLTDDYQHYAAECQRMAAMAHSRGHLAPAMAATFRQWAEEAGGIAARHRRAQAGLTLATKQPAYL